MLPAVSAAYGIENPLEANVLITFLAWAFTLLGAILRPSAACLAAFLVLTARGAHTPEHESLTAAVWFLSGLICLLFVWVARDVENR